MEESLSQRLSELLKNEGADIFGYADLSDMLHSELTTGISVGVRMPRDVLQTIGGEPDMLYYDAYHIINSKLDSIVTAAESFLVSQGYKAAAQTVDRVIEFGNYRTAMPHKTVAVRSGLGWIGKCALFVCKEYGSAVRLSSVLTDAPLDFGTPVTEPLCGECRCCTDGCPSGAVSGKLWSPQTDRDEFFDIMKCRTYAREAAMKSIGKQITLCGKCIYVCPYTQAYLNRKD